MFPLPMVGIDTSLYSLKIRKLVPRKWVSGLGIFPKSQTKTNQIFELYEKIQLNAKLYQIIALTSSAGAKFVKKSVSLKESYNCKTCVIPMIHKFPVKPIKMHLPLKYQVNWSFFLQKFGHKMCQKMTTHEPFFKFLKNCTFKAVVLRKGTSEVMVFATLMYLSTMNMLFKNFQSF